MHCCGEEHVYIPLCVLGTGVSLHELLWNEHQLLWGRHISHCSADSSPNDLSLSSPALMPRDTHTHYIAISCGRRLNLARQVLMHQYLSVFARSVPSSQTHLLYFQGYRPEIQRIFHRVFVVFFFIIFHPFPCYSWQCSLVFGCAADGTLMLLYITKGTILCPWWFPLFLFKRWELSDAALVLCKKWHIRTFPPQIEILLIANKAKAAGTILFWGPLLA